MNKGNSTLEYLDENSQLAIKVVALLKEHLTEDERKLLMKGNALWLAMQHICSPQGAASVVAYSSVSTVLRCR
ncbi:hypothetical protein [Providencia manganoxydans]|uniref:hypothetical protein n=1 Tax=Providencia manganoxydans TaxID=2923283 RepID=UPI0034E46D01